MARADLNGGGFALQQWLDGRKKSQEWMLAAINERRAAKGIAPRARRSNLWRWMTGRQRINVDDATLIQQITGDAVQVPMWSVHRPSEAIEPSEAATRRIAPSKAAGGKRALVAHPPDGPGPPSTRLSRSKNTGSDQARDRKTASASSASDRPRKRADPPRSIAGVSAHAHCTDCPHTRKSHYKGADQRACGAKGCACRRFVFQRPRPSTSSAQRREAGKKAA